MRFGNQSRSREHSDPRRQPFGITSFAPASDDEPSAYEQVTRQGLEDLRRQVDRIEQDVRGLLFGVTGAILIELYRTIVH